MAAGSIAGFLVQPDRATKTEIELISFKFKGLRNQTETGKGRSLSNNENREANVSQCRRFFACHPVQLMSRCKIRVPGRVNLIGEHIDYHNLPVLPMAIPRYIKLEWGPSPGNLVEVESAGYGVRQLRLGGSIEPSAPGDWENYLKAAVKAVQTRWSVSKGFRGSITSDLPSAAGLSSSSALITALTLALLYANDIQPTLEDLMSILPEGEHFVGTRGGGMDHAAVLASREGFASLLRFNPFAVEHVKVPDDWRFLVAHSLVRAEKSGAGRRAVGGADGMGAGGAHQAQHLASPAAGGLRAGDAAVDRSQGDRPRSADDAVISHPSSRLAPGRSPVIPGWCVSARPLMCKFTSGESRDSPMCNRTS